MSNLISINNLYKNYGIKKVIFEDLSLQIESGKIIGLLGPNGSGKTTLIKLLAGLLTPNKGDIKILDNEIGPKTKNVVSYLPERTYFNESNKVSDLLEIFTDFYEDFDRIRACEMLQLLNIDVNDRLKTLSKGTKEKVQLIMTMSRQAKLYLLDEPIAGVDPAARDYILNTILTNYNPEASIIISTHLISDIENILDEVIFLKYGKIVCHSSADELRNSRGQSIDEIFREEFRC